MGWREEGLVGAEKTRACPTVWGGLNLVEERLGQTGTTEAWPQVPGRFHFCCNSTALASGHLPTQQGLPW